MAAVAQFIANRLNAQKSTSERSLSMSLGTPADCFMQNEPNLQKSQMNVTSLITVDYENIANCKLCENKPNTKPIQTQYKPNSLDAQMNISSLLTKDYENEQLR